MVISSILLELGLESTNLYASRAILSQIFQMSELIEINRFILLSNLVIYFRKMAINS